jgi:hypothetical protein
MKIDRMQPKEGSRNANWHFGECEREFNERMSAAQTHCQTGTRRSSCRSRALPRRRPGVLVDRGWYGSRVLWPGGKFEDAVEILPHATK